MKTLIVYSSLTGNTRKLAEAINRQLGGVKTICAVKEAPDPAGYDLVALGFYFMAGKPDPESRGYLKKIGTNRLFLFATHGAAVGSAHASNAMEEARSLAPFALVVGTFDCAGEVNPDFLEKVRKKDPAPPWIQDAPKAMGHPNGEDFQRLDETLKACLPDFLH